MNSSLREILTILQEESAEVSVAVSKILRFGLDSKPKSSLNSANAERLENEIGDFLALVDLVIANDIGVTKEGVNRARCRKLAKLKEWSSICPDTLDALFMDVENSISNSLLENKKPKLVRRCF